jgi:hypothetical protein
MKKNNKKKIKLANIIVKFYPCTDKDVKEYLSSLNLEGIRVGSLINRWAVDVPFYKQSYFSKKFLENEILVEKVYITKMDFKNNGEENE